MLTVASPLKLTAQWLVLAVALVCCITNGNTASICNQTYIVISRVEPSTPAPMDIVDLIPFCSTTATYTIVPSNDSSYFTLPGSTLKLDNPDAEAVLTTNPSVYVNPWTVVINVVETDGNSTFVTVFVTLTSINDFPAKAEHLIDKVNIPESTPPGKVVATCTLVDGDYPGSGHDIPYIEITGGNDDNKFAVDKTSCDIRLIDTLIGVTKTYTLTFKTYNLENEPATSANTYTVTFTITPDDKYPPKCSQFGAFLGVNENTLPGTILTTLNCTNYDGRSDVKYIRDASSSIQYLNVNQTTGDVFVDSALKYSNVASDNNMQITVIVVPANLQDPRTLATVYVKVLDLDDNIPQMTSSTFNAAVPADTLVGTLVLNLTATDADAPNTFNSKLTFKFSKPCNQDWLLLDSSTGSIYVKSKLSRTVSPDITCEASVYSSDKTSDVTTASVTITITDDSSNKPPVFTQFTYSSTLKEDSSNRAPVLTVSATDPEKDALKYSFSAETSSLRDWPFELDPTSGVMSVRTTVDYELQDSYNGSVIVTDLGGLTAIAYITVLILPVNEHSPVFQPVNNASTDRFALPGTYVATVPATDQDKGLDGVIRYSLDDPNIPFVLEEQTGVLRIGIGLDKINVPFYEVHIRATDKSQTQPLSAVQTFRVNLQADNRNHNDPECSPLGPILVTPTSPSLGDPVGYFQCTDADPKTILSYMVIGGDTYNQFEVTQNGTIRLKIKPIAGSYTIRYLISDNGSPIRSTILSLLINVQTDLTFTNLPKTIDIYENSNATDIIYTVIANGAFDIITFEITSGNNPKSFYINQMTGDIRLIRTLDRETIATHILGIRATTNGQSIDQTFTVNVKDKNDNSPTFTSSLSYMKISELEPVPHEINIYSATDLDILENAQIDISMLSGDPSGTFSCSKTGHLSLVKKLDYKTKRFYVLVLLARDRGTPPLETTMTVDIEVLAVNDTKLIIVPSGGTVPITLSENATVGSAVAQIAVQNNGTGSGLNFTIISGNSANNFIINQDTGVVYLVSALDREIVDFMKIGIQVTNAFGNVNNTNLAITVGDYNDNAPFFNPSNYVWYVPNDSIMGSIVGAVTVTDADIGVNAELSLYITSGDPNRKFSFNGKTLVAAAPLNANVQNTYDMVILAADNGTPSLNSSAYVRVVVLPALRSPLFLKKTDTKTFTETSLPGTILYDFDAMANGATENTSLIPGDLVYTLTVGDPNTFFLESDIGVLQQVVAFNYSVQTMYSLVITASNKNNLSLNDNCTLLIQVTQVNIYSPVFYLDMYVWNIVEDTQRGTIIGRVNASDKDPGQYGVIRFYVEQNTYFALNPTTGDFTLTSALDYLTAATHRLRVTAIDNAGVNSKSTYCLAIFNVIDINDHYPHFDSASYEVTVPEDLPSGTIILILHAEDEDSGINGTVTYSIISGNPKGIFHLDSSSGALSLNSGLDFESAQQHMLIVEGKDGGTPSLSNTTIVTVYVKDMNDNAPNFGTSRIDVPIRSDTPAMTPFYTCLATDKDRGMNAVVNYAIQSGNSDHLFSIDTNTGVLKTAASVASAGSYQPLIVEAIDQGIPPLTGSVTIVVTIEPIKNPQPANYDFSVTENRAVGTQVGTIPSDPSFGSRSYVISGGNFGNAFSILTNGTIVTNIVTDRETYNYYQLLISVSTNTTYSVVTANIKILDENDNAPVIVKSVLHTQVVENQPAGYTVGTFSVTDADEAGPNSEFDLYISPATPPATTYFSIDHSGALNLAKSISYEDLSSLEFYVVAKDRGTPPLSSSAIVYVTVIDVNETKVYNYFESPFFMTCDFPDDAVDGDVVCPVTAADVNVTTVPGDQVTYSTVGRESIFTIHPSTGLIQINKQSFVTSTTCFLQWVIVSVKSGGVTTDHALMVRLDTFNRLKHLIIVRVSTDLGDLQSKQAALQANLQKVFQPPMIVKVWSTRSVEPGVTRRRLLASESEALVVVEKDSSTNDVSNIDRSKTFLTTAEALKVLQQSSDGTPVAGVASSIPAVTSVKPYSTSDDSLEPAYIALIVVGSLFLLALIIAIIALIIYCRYYRRSKGQDKKKLVKKKNQSQQTFGNISKPKQSEVRPAPEARPAPEVRPAPEARPAPEVQPAPEVRPAPVVNMSFPADPDSDGMPVQPTRAMFISSSRTPISVTDSVPKKNSSTMLESLEEKNEEDINMSVA